MSLFWKREKAARALIEEYFRAADEAMKQFERAIDCYLDQGPGEKFCGADERLGQCESRADELRDQIELLLYSRALLPESRGDILGLLEAFDHMPNLAETVIFMIYTQRIAVPAEYRDRFREFVKRNLEAYRLVRTAVDLLLSDPDRVRETYPAVDAKESEVDQLERSLIYDIFGSKLERCDMMLLRELISRVGDISDSAERVGRRLELISLKRRI
jgi:predicted phosphate transport protein (TIGR00153 family)